MARLERPAFLLGCGRSGTTILGRTLAEHRALHYLNEPRDLWIRAYPRCDVWSRLAQRRGGRLVLTDADAAWWRTARLSRLFTSSVLRAGRLRLLEKLPVNAFRVRFLRALFPDALFVHLLRNGMEVARSIERECDSGPWYGADDYKWQQLASLAQEDATLAPLLLDCRTAYARGLLEWRLAVEAALLATETLPREQCLTVRYEDLLEAPAITIRHIEDFLGLAHDPATAAHADGNIARRSASADTLQITDDTKRIAGPLLERLGYCSPLSPS
jgi:Sulfotransferase family